MIRLSKSCLSKKDLYKPGFFTNALKLTLSNNPGYFGSSPSPKTLSNNPVIPGKFLNPKF